MRAALIILLRAMGYAAAVAGGSVGFLGFLRRVPAEPMGIVLAVSAAVLVLSLMARKALESGRA